jgi:hypothetical protein
MGAAALQRRWTTAANGAVPVTFAGVAGERLRGMALDLVGVVRLVCCAGRACVPVLLRVVVVKADSSARRLPRSDKLFRLNRDR